MRSCDARCAPTKEQAIEAVRLGLVAFEKYVNARDMNQLMTLYINDVKYMQHGLETIEGSDRLKQHFSRMFERTSKISLSIQEIDASGDMAYAHILTTVTLKSGASDDSPTVVLRVFEVWRLHPDGSWKLTRIAVNNPPSPGGS